MTTIKTAEQVVTDAEVIAGLNAWQGRERLGTTLGAWGSVKITKMRAALEAAAKVETARVRDAAHPEFVPEAVTDAAFKSQENWWKPGDEPVQGVLVSGLIEEVAEAAYRATLAVVDEAAEWEYQAKVAWHDPHDPRRLPNFYVSKGCPFTAEEMAEPVLYGSPDDARNELEGCYLEAQERRRKAGAWEPVGGDEA